MHEILKDLSQWLCLGDNSGFETSGIFMRYSGFKTTGTFMRYTMILGNGILMRYEGPETTDRFMRYHRI